MSENLYYERGRRFLSWRQVLNRHARLVGRPTFRPAKRWFEFWRWFKPDEPLNVRVPEVPWFEFGGLLLPESEATTHFLLLGATGSGKSLLFQLLMNGVLPQLAKRPDQRAFITDPKCELLPTLLARGLSPILWDPFDTRSWAWDAAADIQTPAEAQQLAKALIPSVKVGTDTFWENATRNVLAAVVASLAHFAPGRWTLRDVLLTMRSAESIGELLERRAETAHVWKNTQGDEKTRANLMASFTSYLQRYEVVAALEQQAKRKFSVRQWVQEGGGILLAPLHARYREVLAPLHRLLFDLIADESLSLPDSAERRTWILLDEVRSLGKLEKLYHLANEGRSKGVCLVVGSQSIEGLQEVYGEKGAAEILGQLRSKTFLRTDSQTTAKWIEDHFGQVQYVVEQICHGSSIHDGKRTSTRTVNHSRRRESLILASEVMKLPTPKPGGVFTLLNDLPSVGGCFFTHYGFESLIAAQPVGMEDIQPFIERPTKHQRLLEWTAKDLRRLKLPPILATLPQPDMQAADLFLQLEDSRADAASTTTTTP